MRHDLDLIALRIQGVSLSKLGKIALEAYANGKNISIDIPEQRQMEIDDIQRFLFDEANRKTPLKSATMSSFKCEFSTSDDESIRLLKSIKNTYRNQFVKTLIRNTLTRQSLIPYFTADDFVNKENDNIRQVSQITNESRIPIPMQNKKFRIRDYLKPSKEESKVVTAHEEYVKKEEIIENSDEEVIKDNLENKIPEITTLKVEKPEDKDASDENMPDIGSIFDSLMQQF